jgi:cytochrome c oxidase subunit III
MNIFRQLAEKPWLTPQSVAAPPALVRSVKPARTRAGLWLFLSIVTMLFFLLIMAYAGRMMFEDWRPGPTVNLLWFNTLALFGCSVAMQWATDAARRGTVDSAWSSLLAGGLLALVFLIGQFLAWLQLSGMSDFGLAIPAIAFFYLITGLHALHIAGGLAVWGMTVAKIWEGGDPARIRQNIELCTIYWHFMFGVWVVLFVLLFSGNNMSAVLAFCGLK